MNQLFAPFYLPLSCQKIYVFIFGLSWIVVALRGFCGFSLVAASSGGGERGATPCSALASRCSGFSFCREQALGAWASVVLAQRLSSCGAWA